MFFAGQEKEAGAGENAWVRNGVARAGPNPYTVGARIETNNRRVDNNTVASVQQWHCQNAGKSGRREGA